MAAAVRETAERAARAGISVLPVRLDGSKRPAVSSWTAYQQRIADEVTRQRWYTSPSGVAYIGGAVSGGLEALDFDDRDAFEDFVQLCLSSGLGDLYTRIAEGYLERSPRGVHLLYRCSDARTTKLARRGGSVAIETRGEGSYIIVAPSEGYELVSGSVETIATITDEERELLHDVARALTDEEQRPSESTPPPSSVPGDRPGDEWASMTSWAEILEPHGWTRLWTRGGVTYWRRPGKDRGVSATTNYADSDLLYVFSTSTVLEANRGIGKFGAWAQLEHRGDYGAAARELRAQGYGTARPALELVDLSEFEARASKPMEREADGGFPEHLYDVPGLVGELHRYIVGSAVAPQPILSLGAAIAAVGTLAGRRVQGSSGLLTNVYIAAIGESGSGKEHPRTAIRRAFGAANLGPLASVEDVTSDAAINGALSRHPACLMMFDELGHFIQEAREKQSGVLRTLLRIYGVGVAPYYGKTYAPDRRANREASEYCVWAPCASVYGTTVPGRFWESLTTADVADGFLSRFLVFESADPDPVERNVTVDQQEPPASLVESIGAWHPTHDLALSAALAQGELPAVQTVRSTAGAERVLARFSATMRERREEMRGTELEGFVPLFKRARAFSLKLALIRASGEQGPTCEALSEADMTWGAELATWCVELVLRRAASELGDSDHDRACKEMLAYLEAQAKPVPQSAVTRRFQRMERRLRESVLHTLVESEQAIAVAVKGKRGPTGTAYLHASVSLQPFNNSSTASGE